MVGCDLQARLLSGGRSPSLAFSVSSPFLDQRIGFRRSPIHLRFRCISSRLRLLRKSIRAQASSANIGAGDFDGPGEIENTRNLTDNSSGKSSSESGKPLSRVRYLLSISGVLLGCTVAFSLVAFTKTFFIAALLAMQYDKALVLLGSMGALSLMTIFSVIIGRVFKSVPAQFQTTLPIGEYAAVALLTFFGFKSIKDAWELPSVKKKDDKDSPELGELVEAEELVKEKVAKKLTNPLEIIWKSFSLVFFAEWGDRSMLATIALGAAQSPWGVASGAIAGHLFATSISVVGGAFLANYISEKLVGYLGGILFLIFSIATLLGVF